MATIAGDTVQCPLGKSIENLAGKRPVHLIVRSKDMDAEARAEKVPGTLTLNGHRVVCRGLGRADMGSMAEGLSSNAQYDCQEGQRGH